MAIAVPPVTTGRVPKVPPIRRGTPRGAEPNQPTPSGQTQPTTPPLPMSDTYGNPPPPPAYDPTTGGVKPAGTPTTTPAPGTGIVPAPSGMFGITVQPNGDWTRTNPDTGVTEIVKSQASIDAAAAANKQATDLAAQYDAWLKAQQGSLKTDFETDSWLTNAMRTLNDKMLTQSTANQQALLNEDKYRNQLDQFANRDTRNSLIKSGQFLDQGYASDMAWIQRTWGLAGDQYQADLANLGRLRGLVKEGGEFAQRQYGLSEQGTELQQRTNTFNEMSSATGRGAILSQGHGDTMQAIIDQASIGHGENKLTLDRALSQMRGDLGNLDYQQRSRSNEYKGTLSNLQHQKEGTTISYGQNKNQLDLALSKNGYEGQALQSIAREYGIRSEDLAQTLAVKLDMNGIDAMKMIQGLGEAYRTNNQTLIQQYNAFLAQLLGS